MSGGFAGDSRIERAIADLVPEGSTNAAAGLREGYALAGQAFRSGWINRILLCSDGVANTGASRMMNPELTD